MILELALSLAFCDTPALCPPRPWDCPSRQYLCHILTRLGIPPDRESWKYKGQLFDAPPDTGDEANPLASADPVDGGICGAPEALATLNPELREAGCAGAPLLSPGGTQ